MTTLVVAAAALVVGAAVGYSAGRNRPLLVWKRTMWARYVMDPRERHTRTAKVIRRCAFPLVLSKSWWRLRHRGWRLEHLTTRGRSRA